MGDFFDNKASSLNRRLCPTFQRRSGLRACGKRNRISQILIKALPYSSRYSFRGEFRHENMTGKSVIFGMLGDESKESGISNAREKIGLLLL